MNGSHKQVLTIIKELDEADEESIGSKLAISTEYAAQICYILVKDGYIEKKSDGKFKLTLKGKRLTCPVKARKPLIRF